MEVCPRVSVLCCLVLVEALHRADPPAKESYQMSLYVDQEAHSTDYESLSKRFRTGRLERELQTIQPSATGCSFIAILWDSLVSFVAITLCVASQRVFIIAVYFVMTQSGNFWIHVFNGMKLKHIHEQ
jgi:hypothetical protein